MRKTCLLFDFDGTLSYRDGIWTASVSAVLDRNGYSNYNKQDISNAMQPFYPWEKHDLPHNKYFESLSWWGYIEKHVVGSALSAIGIHGEENVRLAKQFRSEFLRLDAWYLFEDTLRNLIIAKEKGYDCIILSNHTPELKDLTNHLGISKYFEHIVTSAKVGYEKPNPKFYDIIKTFERYDKYIMIGDNYEADILGSINYGLDAIMVRKENVYNYNNYSKDLDGIWDFIDR